MSTTSYKAEILKRLVEGETLKSSDFFYSNSNQYFCELKAEGIGLKEEFVKNKRNRGLHKARSLERSPQNLARAKELLFKYLKPHKKVTVATDDK